jgi:hypothetical protein
MKKSELYKHIQLAVIRDTELYDEVKLEMIKELQHEEDMAKYREDREEKENAENRE